MVEFQQLALSLLVVFGIVLGTGEPLTPYWLLLIPTLLLQGMFNMGARAAHGAARRRRRRTSAS